MQHLHMLIAFISILFFFIRFVLRLANKEPANKAYKIAPHIIDTLLLLSGIFLFIKLQYPLFAWYWLTLKILLVLAYIGLAIAAYKTVLSNKLKGLVFFAAATGCICLVPWLAFVKPSF